MAIDTQIITGRLSEPDGDPITTGSVRFTLSRYDATDNGVIAASRKVDAPLEADGSIALELWPNTAGLRGTTYLVELISERGYPVETYGRIQVGEDGPYSLADLLREELPPATTSYWSTLTKSQYDAAIEAVELSQAWAEGTEPGGTGTKSAQEHAADAEASANRVDLGALDDAVEATEADAVQTALDRVATGDDATATAADRVQTGLDRMYVSDKAVALEGLSISGVVRKESVACATTANITLSGEQTIDGVTTSASRVLVKNQTAAAENGIYMSAAGAWTRAVDMDAADEVQGAAVYVTGGTVGAGKTYYTGSEVTTLGTDAIAWVVSEDQSELSKTVAYKTEALLKADFSGAQYDPVGELDFNDLSNIIFDEAGKVAFGIDQSGNTVSTPANDARRSLDVVQDSEFSELDFFVQYSDGSIPWGVTVYGETISAPTSLNSLPEPTVRRPATGPQYAAELHQHVIQGQSNSFRGGNYLPAQDANERRLSTGIRVLEEDTGNTLVGLSDPSASGSCGIMYNAIQQMKFLMSGGGTYRPDPFYSDDYVMLPSAGGAGGMRIRDLLKGGYSGSYEDGIFGVSEGARLAAASGLIHTVPSISWVQGEDFYSETMEQYIIDFASMIADYRADIPAITGQDQPIKVITYQPSCGPTSATQGATVLNEVALALFDCAQEDKDVIIASPTYWVPHDDLVHLSMTDGIPRFGALWGTVMYKVVYRGEDWRPFEPLQITKHTSRIVTAKFRVPEGPMVFDTVSVSDPGNYGFTVEDENGFVEIETVEIIGGDTVKITTSEDIGAAMVLGYAAYGLGKNGGGPTTGFRGCLRDSDQTIAPSVTAKLPNWCNAFLKPDGWVNNWN